MGPFSTKRGTLWIPRLLVGPTFAGQRDESPESAITWRCMDTYK